MELNRKNHTHDSAKANDKITVKCLLCDSDITIRHEDYIFADVDINPIVCGRHLLAVQGKKI